MLTLLNSARYRFPEPRLFGRAGLDHTRYDFAGRVARWTISYARARLRANGHHDLVGMGRFIEQLALEGLSIGIVVRASTPRPTLTILGAEFQTADL